ncbi:hypothetical protein A7R75_25835 [Mycolicibacterium llatzerense]|nr:hypothetical protein [Mycolicibacterium llatzerense]
MACAAKCLNLLRDTQGWQVVVDDYVSRPHYHVLDDVAESFRIGRMAVFTKVKPTADLTAVIDAWETETE